MLRRIRALASAAPAYPDPSSLLAHGWSRSRFIAVEAPALVQVGRTRQDAAVEYLHRAKLAGRLAGNTPEPRSGRPTHRVRLRRQLPESVDLRPFPASKPGLAI